MTRSVALAVTLVMLAVASARPASAALIEQGSNFLYDTDLDLTWLRNANYAGGRVKWAQAQSFISAMNAGTIENFGFTDWRLPSALNQDGSGPCQDFGCTDSEMGHLFHVEIGAGERNSVLFGDGAVLGLFTNAPFTLGSDPEYYWSGTVHSPGFSWVFIFNNGNQGYSPHDNSNYLWPVRDGSSASMPEPGASALLGLGLFTFVGGRRKR